MNLLAIVIGLAVVLVGLAISIALHELGHLLPAKLFGVRVGQYMIGFGPTVWSRKIGETEYGFKLLPFGGYISMAGMYPPSPAATTKAGRASRGFFATMIQDARAANDETIDDSDDRTFYRLSMWKRIVIMFGGPFMNLVLAALIFTIVFSGFGVQTATNTIANVSECVQTSATASQTCGADDPVAPANAAGLRPGDTITAIDGTPVTDFVGLQSIISSSPSQNLDVTVMRDGDELHLTITPLLSERTVTAADGTTATKEVGFIGVGPAYAREQQPLTAGLTQTGDNVVAVAKVIVQMPQKIYGVAHSLFTGGERDPDGPLSVVGVGLIAGEVATMDAPIIDRVSTVLMLLGSLNIALFVFNLVPLLPLDGGHIAVALWDGLKRAWAKIFRRPAPKPVDATKLVPVTFVVMVLLIGMGALLIAADVFNPVQLFSN